MDQSALTSGTVLSDRYQLEDLISESSGVSTWLGRDRVLNRRVGVQALRADDPRAAAFTAAARSSTTVTDPRFLRVLDIVEDNDGVTYLVREWARALPLDLVVTQSTLTNRRAATVVSEVAEAIGNAHDSGIYHRHLDPGCIQLKASGAVRITGLAVEHALRPPAPGVDDSDLQHAEQLDVEAIGKLLYACLTGRWTGTGGGMLRKAPSEHGHMMRPRQVRAGVSRDVDTVCDRILGTPPRHHQPPLRAAWEIAHELRLAGEDEAHVAEDQPSLIAISSPDLFRNDPVVAPSGPPPAVNPPRRRPKAFEPRPPTTFERSKARARRITQGDKALILLGVAVGVILIVAVSFIIGRASSSDQAVDHGTYEPSAASSGATIQALKVKAITDFDPEGGDGTENPDEVGAAIDGDPDTGWHTSEYYGSADLAGLKSGVGLLLDLGHDSLVTSAQVTLGNSPTSLRLYASLPSATTPPSSIDSLRRIGKFDDAVSGASISLSPPVRTRYLVVWLTRLPQKSDGVYQGDVREVAVEGRP